MSKSKKPIIYITCFFLVLSSVIIPYYNSKASDLVVSVGLASSGTALLGLLAMSGVGMELENNKKFNELSDSDKARLENGLAQNFEEVALQRGASLEKIKSWTSDLCDGVLNKASECWDIFKDWAKNVTLSEGSSDNKPIENSEPVRIETLNGVTFTSSIGDNPVITLDNEILSQVSSKVDTNNNYIGYIVTSPTNSSGYYFQIVCIRNNSAYPYISKDNGGIVFRFNKVGDKYYCDSGSSLSSLLSYLVPSGQQYIKGISASKPVYYVDNSWNVIDDNKNGLGLVDNSTYFSTNTDYLERLRGQEKEQVEIIDVTDIKNPIIESKGNSIARIDWNRGTNNNKNNDDDDQTIKGGLVPANVWYESLDDYIDGQNNAIETYDTHISENPEDKDKYFISPSPIVQVGQYYNILPVVSVPTGGTIVNNYYTYNDYNNFNITIYNEPYNPDIVPNLPMLIFENKFPFCIPWDIFSFVSAFYVEKEAPRIDIPFPIKGANGLDIQTVTIDLSGYEYLSTILRVMFFVLFLVGLMILTRQLIKG